MGLIQDLATIIGAGVTGEDVKSLIEIEKAKLNEPTPDPNPEPTPDPNPEPTPDPKQEPEPGSNNDEIESLRKELDDAKNLIAELQEENRKRNNDDGSHKSDEDLLNDIMLDMY
jgi:hypothetical protein